MVVMMGIILETNDDNDFVVESRTREFQGINSKE